MAKVYGPKDSRQSTPTERLKAMRASVRLHFFACSPPPANEERVIYRERFQARHFDFRGKIIFTRFDSCEFVNANCLSTTAPSN
jgi:hypothetical protein